MYFENIDVKEEPSEQDEWVLQRLVLNKPDKYLPIIERLKHNISKIPVEYKCKFKEEILLAEELGVNINLLTEVILSKQLGHHSDNLYTSKSERNPKSKNSLNKIQFIESKKTISLNKRSQK